VVYFLPPPKRWYYERFRYSIKRKRAYNEQTQDYSCATLTISTLTQQLTLLPPPP
jgi:hypothetical protein